MPDNAGFSQTTWNNYEKAVSNPKIEDLIKISNLFDIAIDALLKTDLSDTHLIENEKHPLNREKAHLKAHGKAHLPSKNYTLRSTVIPVLTEPESPFLGGKMPLVVTVDPSGHDNIVYVPVKARAGYLLGYGDPTYVGSLASFRMPGISNGTYRMFEVEGPSMGTTITSGDRVIGEWVENYADMRENRVYIVVHKGGVAVKRAVPRLSDGKIFLKSDTLAHRAEYPILEVDVADILEVWYVRMRITANLSEPTEIYTKVNDLELLVHKLVKKIGIDKP